MFARMFAGVLAGALLSLATPAGAEERLTSAGAVTIGEAMTLNSAYLGEERRILVHLPPEYEREQRRYPVLYLLDGDTHFAHVSGAVDFLAQAGRIPSMIVVGVANTQRSRDMAPHAADPLFVEQVPALGQTIKGTLPASGGADAFLEFLSAELAPAVEAKYSTAQFRILAGHSLGGLFAAHAMLAKPDFYDGVIAISPSLWWDDGALVKQAASELPDFGGKNHWLYMVSGEEGGTMLRGLDDLGNVLELADPAGLERHVAVLSGEKHASTPHPAMYEGLQWMFRKYPLPEIVEMAGDLSRIERHYDAASREYGFDLSRSEAELVRLGRMQLRELNRPEAAVAIFQRVVELYPRSAEARRGLADGLELLGQTGEALAAREAAKLLNSRRAGVELDGPEMESDPLRIRLGEGY